MDGIQLVASILSGGLAGGSVSTAFNRVFHWRGLRTKFHPVLNNMWGAYLNRMEQPEGRYLVNTVGYVPAPSDLEFVNHRSEFLFGLIEFNELKEARILHLKLIANINPMGLPMGQVLTTDLMPDYWAVNVCLTTVQKKLKI